MRAALTSEIPDRTPEVIILYDSPKLASDRLSQRQRCTMLPVLT